MNSAWSVYISLLIQMAFSIEKATLYRGLYFGHKQKVNLALIMDFFLTNMQILASQDVNWWTGFVDYWCFYQLFGLSFWRHPFTAEDPLVRKWCNAKLLQICLDGEKNLINILENVIYILDGLRVCIFQQMFNFGWTIFKMHYWVIISYILLFLTLVLTDVILQILSIDSVK